jgi:iron complex outermembrane receptor protein
VSSGRGAKGPVGRSLAQHPHADAYPFLRNVPARERPHPCQLFTGLDPNGAGRGGIPGPCFRQGCFPPVGGTGCNRSNHADIVGVESRLRAALGPCEVRAGSGSENQIAISDKGYHMRRRSSISQFQMSAIALAIAATSGVAVPALAQEAGLEEIVVTAQRREESLQDTPISITAFTENKLTDLGVFDVAQVADFAPNVNIQKQPSSNGNMGIFIRGMGMGETSLLADPKVGMYIDGVFMSKTVGAVFDVVDIERVEVLRGPQGTLFGRNTTGGAVNVTTKKPTGEWGFKADASVGNFGYSRTGVSIDFPKIANVAAKVSLNRMKTDGWADNNYSGPAQTPMGPRDEIAKNLASEDNWAGRLALRWTPTEAVTVDYSYDMTDNQGVPAPFQITKVKDSLYNGFSTTPFPFTFLGGSLYQDMAATVGDPKKRRDDYNLDAVSDEWLDIEGHTLTVAWELSDTLTLKYIGGMRSVDSGYDSTDLDSGAYIARDLFYGGGAAVPTPGFHAAIDKGNISTDTHELQIIGSLMDEKLFFTGGLFTYKEKVVQVNPQTFSLPIAFIAQQGANTPFLGPLYNGASAPARSACPSSTRSARSV